MERVTRDFLTSKAHAVRRTSLCDTSHVESMMTKVAEDIMELRGMLTLLKDKRDSLTLESYDPLVVVSHLETSISHVNVMIIILYQRKNVVSCCLKSTRASSSEMTSFIEALSVVPVEYKGESDESEA